MSKYTDLHAFLRRYHRVALQFVKPPDPPKMGKAAKSEDSDEETPLVAKFANAKRDKNDPRVNDLFPQPKQATSDLFPHTTKPEQDWMLDTARQSDLDRYTERVNESLKKPKNNVELWNTTVPHVNTVQTLAEFGSPARGEYANAAKMVQALFGHDPDGVPAWLGLNGVFSPQTQYLHHAGAASMITASWLAAGKPKDEATIRRLIARVHEFGQQYDPWVATNNWGKVDAIPNFLAASNPRAAMESWNEMSGNPMIVRNIPPRGKPIPSGWAPTFKYKGVRTGETFGGTTGAGANIEKAVSVLQNIERMREALEDPHSDAGRDLALLGGQGMLKVPNFTISYLTPHLGSAIDVHMGRLAFHPDLEKFADQSSILSQVRTMMSPEEQSRLSELEQRSLKGIPIRSDLIKSIIPYGQRKLNLPNGRPGTLNDWLKLLSSNLNSDPAHYMAYKHVIAEAAKKLGWSISEVQESVWTGVMGLMAANTYGIPPHQITRYITNDLVRKGWQNHEAFYFPKLIAALRRGGTEPSAIRELEQRAHAAAEGASLGGAVPVRDVAHLGRIAAHLPTGTANDAARPIRQGIKDVLQSFGGLLPDGKVDVKALRRVTQGQIDQAVKKITPAPRPFSEGEIQRELRKFLRPMDPIRLAGAYDATTNFQSAETRANSENTAQFLDRLRDVLTQAGVIPEELRPAIHDVSGQARMAVLALGKYGTPQASATAAAWTGLLGRQPGMVAFTAHPQGPDSIYSFTHPNADSVRLVLNQHGVPSRTLVPDKANYRVYIYDQGRKQRSAIGKALQSLGVTADEWSGAGQHLGGDMQDMGRSSYRDQINRSEQPQQMMRGGNEELQWRKALTSRPRDAGVHGAYADWIQEHEGEGSFEAEAHRQYAKALEDSINKGVHPLHLLTSPVRDSTRYLAPDPHIIHGFLASHPYGSMVSPYIAQAQQVHPKAGSDPQHPIHDPDRIGTASVSYLTPERSNFTPIGGVEMVPQVIRRKNAGVLYNAPFTHRRDGSRLYGEASRRLLDLNDPQQAEAMRQIYLKMLGHMVSGNRFASKGMDLVQTHNTDQTLYNILDALRHLGKLPTQQQEFTIANKLNPFQLDRQSAASMKPPIKLTLQDILTAVKKSRKKKTESKC